MVHESLQAEAAYSERIRDFARLLNGRLVRMVFPNRKWVRIRPPTTDEIESLSRDLRCVKFLRVGTVVTVLEGDDPALRPLSDCSVDVSCAGDRILWGLEDFLGTFVRAVPEESWEASDRHHLEQQLVRGVHPL